MAARRRGQSGPRELQGAVLPGRRLEEVLAVSIARSGTIARTPYPPRVFPLYSFPFSAMASRCEALVHAPDGSAARARSDAAIAEVRRIETKYSRYRDDSVTTAINRAAGGEAISVDEETAALLDFGAELHSQSDGLFDLSSGVLRRAWDFKLARLPDPSELERLLELVGWSQVEWSAPSLRLPRAGMEIDFGGIGKEYAADRAATAMAERGAVHGLVNLGGDVR